MAIDLALFPANSERNNAEPIPIGAPINNAPPAIKAVPDNNGNIPKLGLVPLGTHLVPKRNSRIFTLGSIKKENEPSSEQKINIPNDSELLDIQKHDLHKLKIKGFKPHKEALTESNMKRADGVAAWFSRNSDESEFDLENRFYIRDSYVLDLNKRYIESQIIKKREEIFKIFSETDPAKLHDLILQSELLNRFAESRVHNYSSYKYHILLTCSLYWNFHQNNRWEQLYLTNNKKIIKSIYQIIYQDKDRVWALVSEPGMSRVSPKFCETWVRRTKLAIGGDHVLDGLLSQITSWSEALATIEDWRELHG